MNEDEFTSEKKSLISKLLKKKKRMIHYSNELFLEIINEEYNFKKNENYAALTENLTKENILAFYQVFKLLIKNSLILISFFYYYRNTSYRNLLKEKS